MKCAHVFTEAWASSTEGALPGALGVKCPIRSVEEVKDRWRLQIGEGSDRGLLQHAIFERHCTATK